MIDAITLIDNKKTKAILIELIYFNPNNSSFATKETIPKMDKGTTIFLKKDTNFFIILYICIKLR